MKDVFITAAHVELYKVLKFEGLVPSGGEAKAAIDAGLVLLNGASERQKRKKLVAGDVITFDGLEMRIQSTATAESPPVPPSVHADGNAPDE